jgi:predicted N-acetyltransferase YhbS
MTLEDALAPRPLVVRPARAGDEAALVALFEAAGSPCFCRFFHFEGDTNAWLARCYTEPGVNAGELAAAVREGRADGAGLVAEAGDELVGWAKLAPVELMKKRYEGRFYRGLSVLSASGEGSLGSREGGATLGCLLVRPDHRGRGVAGALARGAVREARERGYRFVEAFPRTSDEALRPDELWTGTLGVYLRAGFRVVHEARGYPVVRWEPEPGPEHGEAPGT